MKYMGRGFNISTNPWHLRDHTCESGETDRRDKDGYCPHRLRSTINDEVLHWKYIPRETLEGTTISCKEISTMVWCFRGFECKDGNKEDTISLLFVSS
jgi:hypothetical protein